MSKITYKNKDLFADLSSRPKGQFTFIPHIVNNVGIWGGGFTQSINLALGGEPREYYKSAQERYSANPEVLLGSISVVPLEDRVDVVHMFAQHQTLYSNRKPIRYVALVETMSRLDNLLKNLQGMTQKKFDYEIWAPKFGSGLAGGNWSLIEELIKEIWSDHKVVVYDFVP